MAAAVSSGLLLRGVAGMRRPRRKSRMGGFFPPYKRESSRFHARWVALELEQERKTGDVAVGAGERTSRLRSGNTSTESI